MIWPGSETERFAVKHDAVKVLPIPVFGVAFVANHPRQAPAATTPGRHTTLQVPLFEAGQDRRSADRLPAP